MNMMHIPHNHMASQLIYSRMQRGSLYDRLKSSYVTERVTVAAKQAPLLAFSLLLVYLHQFISQ